MTFRKLNPFVSWGLRVVGAIIVVAVIPLLNMVRSQDREMQLIKDTAQDVQIKQALAQDSVLAARLTAIEEFDIHTAIWQDVDARNTKKIMEMLGARPDEIREYPNVAVNSDSTDTGG